MTKTQNLLVLILFLGDIFSGISAVSVAMGCYADKQNDRDLPIPNLEGENSKMTHSKCIEFCSTQEMAYAGAQYGWQCYCGNTYGRHGNSTKCTVRCAGDSSQICGAGYINSVFKTGYVKYPEILGCYKDTKDDRDLPISHAEKTNDDYAIMTHQRCVSYCYALEKIYAGLQYGKGCWCGDWYGKHGPSTSCNMPCSGDDNQICGGDYATTVIKTGNGPEDVECLLNAKAEVEVCTSDHVYKALIRYTQNMKKWENEDSKLRFIDKTICSAYEEVLEKSDRCFSAIQESSECCAKDSWCEQEIKPHTFVSSSTRVIVSNHCNMLEVCSLGVKEAIKQCNRTQFESPLFRLEPLPDRQYTEQQNQFFCLSAVPQELYDIIDETRSCFNDISSNQTAVDCCTKHKPGCNEFRNNSFTVVDNLYDDTFQRCDPNEICKRSLQVIVDSCMGEFHEDLDLLNQTFDQKTIEGKKLYCGQVNEKAQVAVECINRGTPDCCQLSPECHSFKAKQLENIEVYVAKICDLREHCRTIIRDSVTDCKSEYTDLYQNMPKVPAVSRRIHCSKWKELLTSAMGCLVSVVKVEYAACYMADPANVQHYTEHFNEVLDLSKQHLEMCYLKEDPKCGVGSLALCLEYKGYIFNDLELHQHKCRAIHGMMECVSLMSEVCTRNVTTAISMEVAGKDTTVLRYAPVYETCKKDKKHLSELSMLDTMDKDPVEEESKTGSAMSSIYNRSYLLEICVVLITTMCVLR